MTFTPETGLKMSLQQLLAGIAVVIVAGYYAGAVHADQTHHEAQEGHPALVKRVQTAEQTLLKVSLILERLEKRGG